MDPTALRVDIRVQFYVNNGATERVIPVKAKEQSLLARAKQGDMDAFAELFDPLRPRIRAVAYRLLGDSDADDMVMDTFLKAWQALPGFAGRSALSTWLCGIARNRALDIIRKRQREAKYVTPEGELKDIDSRPDPLTDDAPEQIARGEDRAQVRRALQEVPELHRQALLLRYVDELSYAEIATALDLSIGTVMSRLFNAKRKLAQALARLTDARGAR